MVAALFFKYQRFLRFAAVGAVCTVVDFSVFFPLHYYGGVGVVVAQIAAYSAGIVANFFLNRRFTFADSQHKSNKRLTIAFLWGYCGLMLSTALVWSFAQLLPVWLAKVLTVGIMMFVNYAANKWIVFRIT